MHLIRAHQLGHTYNERVDALSKAATTLQVVDMAAKFSRRQVKKHLLGQAFSIWQQRWRNSENGRVAYDPVSHTE